MSYPFTGHACEFPWKMCSHHSALYKHCWGWSEGIAVAMSLSAHKTAATAIGRREEKRGGEEIADKMADGAIARPATETPNGGGGDV